MTADELDRLALECGIDQVSALPAGPTPVDGEAFAGAVAAAPVDLGYLGRTMQKRLDPRLVWPGTRTVITGIVSYEGGPPRPSPLPDGTGWISRYAMIPDYHSVVGARFKDLAAKLESDLDAKTLWYVDTGPVAEKAWAVAAGLGFQGRNTLMISPRFGSGIFIGVILTDLEIERPAVNVVKNGCGNCTACVSACPTAALDENGRMDRSRCISYLTTSAKSPIPDGINLDGNLFGCDICQDVCPYNRRHRCGPPIKPDVEPTVLEPLEPDSRHPGFDPMPGLFCPSLQDILNMDEPTFALVFRGSPVFRRGLAAVQNVARTLLSQARTGTKH